MELDKVKKITNSIHGWIWEKEGEILYNLAKICSGEGVIVEIGSWKGRSTIWLGMGSKAGIKTKIYAIDPHTGSDEQLHKQILGEGGSSFSEFKANIKYAELNNLVVPLVKTSEEASKMWSGEKIELLWIDGAHEYELVNLDYKLWEPYLVEGGVIAFHDSHKLAIRRVIDKYLFKGNKFKNIGLIYTITLAQKSESITRKDKINKRIMFFLKNLEFHIRRLNLHEKKLIKKIWEVFWNKLVVLIGEGTFRNIKKNKRRK